MGTICGPSRAYIFVLSSEQHWYQIIRPLIYLRLIDDTFLVTKTKINLEEFKSQFDNLKLSTTSGTTVNFLDLNISMNFITNTLNFKLFT